MPGSTRLSDSEVRNRLETCTDSPDVIDEIYNFGQILLKEAVDRIKTTESKATAFAAYGSAIVTLLVSTSSLWYRLGNQWTLWIAACAGLSGFACAMLSIKGLLVRTFYVISQDEWLNATCLSTGKVESLKQYHVLTMWGAIDSHEKVQEKKAIDLRRAEVWLSGAVIFMVYLLFHVAFIRTFSHWLWVAFGKLCKNHPLGIPGWQLLVSPGVLGGLLCGLALGLTLLGLFRRSRSGVLS